MITLFCCILGILCILYSVMFQAIKKEQDDWWIIGVIMIAISLFILGINQVINYIHSCYQSTVDKTLSEEDKNEITRFMIEITKHEKCTDFYIAILKNDYAMYTVLYCTNGSTKEEVDLAVEELQKITKK